MLGDWLHWTPHAGARDDLLFDRIDIEEKDIARELAVSGIVSILQDALVDPEFLKLASEILDWEQLRQLASHSIPLPTRVRKGAMGEALATAMLEEFHAYLVPIRKLHYTITRGQTLPGTDILALKVDTDGEIAEMCFVEVKFRTTSAFAGSAIEEAIAQLKLDSDERLPGSLQFLATRLHSEGSELTKPIMRYLRSRLDLSGLNSYRVFLVWDRDSWSEATFSQSCEAGAGFSPLTFHIAQLNALKKLAADVYAQLPAIVLGDEDE